MIGVIDFYERPPDNYRDSFYAGLICRAPIPFYLDEQPHRIQLDYFDPGKPGNSNYKFERTDFSDFDPSNDPPLRHSGLERDDFLLSVGYKLRHCIILSDPLSSNPIPAPGTQGFLVAPMYSIYDQSGNYRTYINREMVLRAQAYQLNNVFYLPKSDKFDIQESFARIDRIEFVRIEHLFPKPIKLTEKATDLLRQWSWFYQGMPIVDPSLEEYIKRTKEELDKRLGGN